MVAKNIKASAVMTLLFICLMMCTASKVYASEVTADITLTIHQTFKVHQIESATVDQTGYYELTAVTADTPMPDGADKGRYRFFIKSNSNQEIPLRFVHGGKFTYQLVQVTKDTDNYSYDRTCYTITVYVINGEAGELIPQVIVENGNGKKSAGIMFENSYGDKLNRNKDMGSPTTGDTANLALWAIIMLLALAGIIVTMLYSKKRSVK